MVLRYYSLVTLCPKVDIGVFCALSIRFYKRYLEEITMANDVRVKVTLSCTECKQRNYNTTKNKRNNPERLEMMKYCKFCRKETLHRETK